MILAWGLVAFFALTVCLLMLNAEDDDPWQDDDREAWRP